MSRSDQTLTFLGDVACPDELVPSLSRIGRLPFEGTMINLEGALCPSDELGSVPTRALYNSAAILPALADWNVRAAVLANNHIMDLGGLPSETSRRLADVGIDSVGAGDDLVQAGQSLRLVVAGEPITMLAYNWEVIRRRSAGKNRPGANPLEPSAIFDAVHKIRATQPEARVVIQMHWNIELERYPQPAQRRLAFDLIDAGVAAIIGHHPHCAQGIEWHRDRPIVYSLGDWFLPQGDYFGQKIYLPEYTYRQLAFEWDPGGEHSKCHWFDYDRHDHALKHVASEPARNSERVRELTPFAGLSHEEYVGWFTRHRVKSRGLPIYRDYRHTAWNRCLDLYCIGRGWIIRQAAAWKVRERGPVSR